MTVYRRFWRGESIHLEILADDPKRAVKFYKKVFGWKIKKLEGPVDYWLVTTSEDNQPGINGTTWSGRAKDLFTTL